MKIAAALRVRNEGRWIKDVIRSLAGLCDPIVVLDDHSDDGTPEICRTAGATVIESEFSGTDETRDRNFLLQQINSADWALMIDGDEFLEPDGQEKIRRLIARAEAPAYALRSLYLWNSNTQVRMDGIYRFFYKPVLWKLAPGQSFEPTYKGLEIHCACVPAQLAAGAVRADIALLHLGYRDREDRLRKFAYYNSLPVPANEDGYRHMVIGDTLPSETITRWAGPLKLEPLEAVLPRSSAQGGYRLVLRSGARP